MLSFVLLSRSSILFGDVREPSLKCFAACLRSWTGMWSSSFQKKVLRTNLRKVTWESLQCLLRLLFCVSIVKQYLNQKPEQPTEFRSGKPGFQTLLGMRSRGDCSVPRGILITSSGSLSLAPWVQCVCLWDPSLGVHFSCQQMDGSPQLLTNHSLAFQKTNSCRVVSLRINILSRSCRVASLPVSFYHGVMSVAACVAAFWNNCFGRV